MSELHAWDLDGTIRPGSLVGDAVSDSIAEGIIDGEGFEDPANPTLEEIWRFVGTLPGRSLGDFKPVTDRITEEAQNQAYPWAVEKIQWQTQHGHAIILSYSPDFLVRAFAKGLDMHRGRGSYYHTQKLVFSGHAVTLNKKTALRRYMRNRGITTVSFAAGDTEADVPVLELAEHAVVVNPNDQLAQLAMRKAWEIVETNELETKGVVV